MKAILLFVLLACSECCLGQTDTNFIAGGDWSEPVKDEHAGTLRGRLLVYEGEEHCPMGESIYGNARVYLELQHGFSGGWYLPIEVYFDITHGLQFEIRDASGSPVRSEPYSTGAFLPSPCWLTLPCDSIVRVRADPGWGSQRKTEGVSILLLNGGLWVIRPGSTNESFLSATVSPPTNHQSALKYNVWQGTLKLPKVKIPAKKP